jgi:hypothetical protein
MDKTNKTSTGDCSTGYRSTGDYSTGDCSTGDYSTGNYSTGNYSTGNYSTGDCSTGDYSTGDCSTGYRSTGDYSTGDCSTGDYSTGNYSTGSCSTGNRSTGHRSTGNWSISNYSTGHFSTEDYSGFGCFDKPCTPEEWEDAYKPAWLYFDLTEWVKEEYMTEEEKKDNPKYSTTGGYLKVYDYEEAFQRSYLGATREEQLKVMELPNYDAKKFYKISGIDVDGSVTGVATGVAEQSKCETATVALIPEELVINGVTYIKKL